MCSSDLLSAALRADVQQARPSDAAVDVQAQSPDRLGMTTPAATRQRYGNALGHSLVPQRPPQSYAPAFPPTR